MSHGACGRLWKKRGQGCSRCVISDDTPRDCRTPAPDLVEYNLVRTGMRNTSLILGVGLLIVVFHTLCLGQNSSSQVIGVKLEANQWDADLLLKKLNEHGRGRHLEFVLADEGYEYRIAFETGQKPVGTVYGDVNASVGTTTVYDAQEKEVFSFRREGRWTDSGATNAAAKEIIKRLYKLRQTVRK
jgi:hypothetical protein